jgi:nitrite reductase (NO-forming)
MWGARGRGANRRWRWSVCSKAQSGFCLTARAFAFREVYHWSALARIRWLQVGETVRIFFGVGGPNATSSLHVIGEIFDRVYSFADLISSPLQGVQTITVPAGGAAIVEFKLDVPGNYILVDHALSRAERGLVGVLQVEGPTNPEIFDGKVEPGVGH